MHNITQRLIKITSIPTMHVGFSILLVTGYFIFVSSPVHAQCGLFGCITPPPTADWVPLEGTATNPGGLVRLISRLIQLFIAIAGLYVLVNIVIAGYQYISAGGNSQNLEAAWGRIWQSFVGMAIVAGSLLITSIISWLIFDDPTFILNPVIGTP